jgi:uncharacterized protein with HEPN domain
MKKVKQWQPHAQHIIKSINEIIEFQTRGNIEYDTLVYAGTLRNLHMVAESAGYIPEEIREHYPHIAWKAIAGFRNFIVHDYLGNNVNLEVIRTVINRDLPELKAVVQDIINRHGP